MNRKRTSMHMRRNRESTPLEEKSFISEDSGTQSLASCMNRIYRLVRTDGFSHEAMQELEPDTAYVAERFGIDREGAVLLSAILEKSGTSNQMDDEDLAMYLGCTNIEFIRFHEKLRDMDKAGIIHFSGRLNRRSFGVTSEALKAVESNGVFTPIRMSGLTTEEVFIRFKKFFDSFRNDAIDCGRLLDELDTIVSRNDHLTFCRRVMDSVLFTDCSDTERRIFYYLCHRYVTHGETSVSLDILTNLTEFMEDDECLKRHFSHEHMVLQTAGLVSLANEDGFVDSSSLSLSDQVRTEFFTDIVIEQEETAKYRDIVRAESITAKDLFYNKAEGEQVGRLASLLEERNFKDVQNRMVSSGMRKGFNAIFYGVPGTGKTASVYELARRTGRDIFHVDVAKLKSKWVGDSEKSVRTVFRIYRRMCRNCAKAPIMLFNEADAIFSKRIENVEQVVDQMNNAIQNIILEEMENMEGILIATTNLLTNLDPAFERRFIYKVEFKMPEKDSRAKIWKSMLPSLSEDDAETLAGRFVFSGGNIENVARKSTVEYILSGNEPTLSSLETYCQEENLNHGNNGKKIGF